MQTVKLHSSLRPNHRWKRILCTQLSQPACAFSPSNFMLLHHHTCATNQTKVAPYRRTHMPLIKAAMRKRAKAPNCQHCKSLLDFDPSSLSLSHNPVSQQYTLLQFPIQKDAQGMTAIKAEAMGPQSSFTHSNFNKHPAHLFPVACFCGVCCCFHFELALCYFQRE